LNLRTKAPVALVVAAAGIFGASGYVCYYSQRDYIESNKHETMAALGERLKSSFASIPTAARQYAEFVAAMPPVKKALKAGDLDALAAELGPSYKLMKSKYGAEAASFQAMTSSASVVGGTGAVATATIASVLRLANPDDRVEYDQSRREMVVRANHQKETQAGLEVMSTTVSVRAVASIDDGTTHLGSFEWGTGFERLLKRIKEDTSAELALFIDEKAFVAPITSRGAALQKEAAKSADSDRVAEGFRTLVTTDPEFMKRAISADFLPTVQVMSFREVVLGDSEFGIVAVPVRDFGERQVGVVVAVRNMDEARRVARSTLIMFVGATITGLVLLAGAIQLVFNGLLVRPLVELTENLGAIAGGDLGVKLELAARADEVGALAKKLDKLRQRLADEKADAGKSEVKP
jgi:HAMP domain-containing protein